MNALVLALLLVSQPGGLLPRKPSSPHPDSSSGPANAPGEFPTEPVAPPLIVDEPPPSAGAPAPAPPAPAPSPAQPSAASSPATASPATPSPAPAPVPPQASAAPPPPVAPPTTPPPSTLPPAPPRAPAQSTPPAMAAPGAPPALRSYPGPKGPGPAPLAPGHGTGQWILTQRYGWVFMARPEAPPRVYGQPFAYVYRPSYGWTWVEAPWLIGPRARPGVYGPPRFGWPAGPGRWPYLPGPYYARPWPPA